MLHKTLLLLLFACCLFAQNIGKRPYEMDWAGRTQDDHPVLMDFEQILGWSVEAESDMSATVTRSREQQMYGLYVLKVAYQSGKDGHSFKFRPAKPQPIPADFDAMTLWVYGNPNAIRADANKATLSVLFQAVDGTEHSLPMASIRWHEWFLCHYRLTEEEQKLLHQPGTRLTGFMLSNCLVTAPRVIYLDSLSLYKESFAPLSFPPRAQRNLTLFPGQDAGINTGNDRLPFPTREDTILPDSAAPGSRNTLATRGNAYDFTYDGSDGQLIVSYVPQTGTWSDFTASWNGGPRFQPLAAGGARFPSAKNGLVPEQAVLDSSRIIGNTLETIWSLRREGLQAKVAYRFALRGKTLVLDTMADTAIGVVSYGSVKNLKFVEAIQIPYYDYANPYGRPAVVLARSGDTPLFLSGHTDWYRSNSSRPWGVLLPPEKGVQFNGQVEYLPKTNGERNAVFERFFVTISPKFEEHLPNLPNPKSPWKDVTGTHVWRAYGATNREFDKKYWYNIWRHGMRKCLITDHETGWRDGEESFTFRTRPAPGKGGDAGQYDYARYMQDKLGFVYGPYNNFTDFAPVNKFWNTDMVARLSNNQLMHAWRRCYAPKPVRAVEYCEKLAPVIQSKFHFSTAYCDVHTSTTPWGRCDYDFRVPGAATFAQVFYCFGEIMLLQKKAWNGPVYSEGPHFCYYSGLTDGNYAQDRTYGLPTRPWLVDFDLRKIHEQECNFGMGNPNMFYGENKPFGQGGKSEMEACIDRFLTATAAFGHPGFLVSHGGIRTTMRSYFLFQQLASRYTRASATRILYADNAGHLWETSQALVNQAYKRSQVVVDYSDGTHVVANGSQTDMLKINHAGRDIELPPNGFMGWTDDGAIEVFSGLRDGHRMDYAATPEYIYLDGRDGTVQNLSKAAGSGCAVCRSDDATHWEIIPLQGACNGFAINGGNARALAHDGTDLGPAKTVRYNGLLYVIPVKDAFSYRLDKHAKTAETRLACNQHMVIPGSVVTVQTPDGPVKTKIEGKPGETVWFQHGDEALCFTLRELVNVSLEISQDSHQLLCRLSNPGKEPLELQCIPDYLPTQAVTLDGRAQKTLAINLPKDNREGLLPMSVSFISGEYTQRNAFGLIRRFGPDIVRDDFLDNYKPGAIIYQNLENSDIQSSGYRVEVTDNPCGGILRHGFFMHPAWKNGFAGSTYSEHKLSLPDEPLRFTALVGKKDGSHTGDGITFQVILLEEGKPEKIIAERHVIKHEWQPLEADFKPWAGKDITLRLVSNIGPQQNHSGDWACWADIHIERLTPKMHVTIDSENARYATRMLNSFVPNLKESELRSAVKGRLCYQGQGLNSDSASYPTNAILNGIDLGVMEKAHGSERDNVWSEVVGMDLSPAAIATLSSQNQLVLVNKSQDYFKVTGFYLELTLADGRIVTSLVSTAIFTQPHNWVYAEGILVPFEKNIFLPLGFGNYQN